LIGVRIGIFASLLILSVGYAIVWRRRDNVLAYVDGGLFLVMMALPLMATRVVERFPASVAGLYAKLLLIGSIGYALGIACGLLPGNLRSSRRPPIFAERLGSRNPDTAVLYKRARILGLVAASILAGGFAAIGYVPILAADRLSAKYGVGAYQAGFAQGSLIYRTGLALAAAALPLVLVVFYRRHKLVDLAIGSFLGLGLIASLSRTLAFSGVMLVLVAILIEKKVGPTKILLTVACVFALGELSTEVIFPSSSQVGNNLISRLAEGPPDVRDHMSFLTRYETQGERTRGLTILGGLDLQENYWEPNLYALRTLTGNPNVGGIPSGGLRLPAPIWGYVSFGLIGAGVWSFLAGFFAGWGAKRLKNLLTGLRLEPGSSVNLVVAAVYYAGTFGVLSTFYFASTAMIAQVAISLYVGAAPIVWGRKPLGEKALTVRSSGPPLP
jgi:hypothetical protein